MRKTLAVIKTQDEPPIQAAEKQVDLGILIPSASFLDRYKC
jgi:hypothetical protein